MTEPRIASAVGIAVTSRKASSQEVQAAMERAVHQGIQEGVTTDAADMKARVAAAQTAAFDNHRESRERARQSVDYAAYGDPVVAAAMDAQVYECMKAGLLDEDEIARRLVLAADAERQRLAEMPEDERARFYANLTPTISAGAGVADGAGKT